MQIGTAIRAKPGEDVCGDAILIREIDDLVVIIVADGLGHGPGAAKASQAACDFIRGSEIKSTVAILDKCGKFIRSTRGAAVTALTINKQTGEMSFAGVGNVEMKARTKEKISPVNSPGIVGRKVRRTIETCGKLMDGDLLIIYSDGISSRFRTEKYKDMDAQKIADMIMENHSKDHDDATCVVVKY